MWGSIVRTLLQAFKTIYAGNEKVEVKIAERIDKQFEKEYTKIRIVTRCPVMSELYSRLQPFLGDESLDERMAGWMDVWEESVRLFPRYEMIEKMDDALQTGKNRELYIMLHRLKGCLLNFGFASAAGKAEAVEQAMKAEKTGQVR